jgi:hypothetical protein
MCMKYFLKIILATVLFFSQIVHHFSLDWLEYNLIVTMSVHHLKICLYVNALVL